MIKRAHDYEQLLSQYVSQSVDQINCGDVCADVSYSQSVSFEFGKLHAVDDVSYSSLACRIFENGKVGNAFVNNPLQYQKMISDAKESSLFGEEIDIHLPGATSYPSLDWSYSDKNIQYSKHDLKDIGSELIKKIQKIAPNAKISVDVHQSCSRFFLKNTNGFYGEYIDSSLYIQGGLFELSHDDSFIELYEGVAFYDQEIDFDQILLPLQGRLDRLKNPAQFSYTGQMPVIFAPSALDSLLDPIEIAANGKILCKDLSLFKGKVGEQLFDSNFQFDDDPFYKYGSASLPFDDEGTVGQKMSIVKNGIFQHFIFDCTTAKKSHATSTGHASRSPGSLPSPSFSNRVIGKGSHSLEEMISSIDRGLLLESSLGEGQSNVIAGDFSVLGDHAFLIEKGRLKGRVKDVMLSGNAFEVLKNIPMIENKFHKQSSLFAPHLLIQNINVTTK
ncbi:MAG: TldD/PmbA family protein [Brevinema sp.]